MSEEFRFDFSDKRVLGLIAKYIRHLTVFRDTAICFRRQINSLRTIGKVIDSLYESGQSDTLCSVPTLSRNVCQIRKFVQQVWPQTPSPTFAVRLGCPIEVRDLESKICDEILRLLVEFGIVTMEELDRRETELANEWTRLVKSR